MVKKEKSDLITSYKEYELRKYQEGKGKKDDFVALKNNRHSRIDAWKKSRHE